jgi:hypothetical protein
MILKTTKVTRAVKAKLKHKGGDILTSKKYLPVGENPNATDVVSGRGSGAKHHAGNKRYWALILGSRETFEDLNRIEKIELAETIMEMITASNGRFLQNEPKVGRWFVIPKSFVLFKIKQALSQRDVPIYMRGERVEPIREAPTDGSNNLEIQQVAIQLQSFRFQQPHVI